MSTVPPPSTGSVEIDRSTNEASQSEPVTRFDTIGSSAAARFKELIIKNVNQSNLSVLAAGSDEPLYFMVNTIFTFNRPHITLHAGSDQLGPVLGVAYIPQAGANQIGLGDPKSNIGSVVWESLARTSTWTHSRYQFGFIFGEEGRKLFIWERVRSNPFDDQSTLELVQEDKPGVVLARFESSGVFKWKNRGNLFIVEGYGDAWELMVVLTGLSLIVLSRRRARQRR